MRRAYPLHPEVLRRFSDDWSMLEKFQRTRGILEIMANAIHALWSGGSAAPLITPALQPFRDVKVRTALLERLDRAFGPILQSEVDGEQALSARIEAQRPRLLRARASTPRGPGGILRHRPACGRSARCGGRNRPAPRLRPARRSDRNLRGGVAGARIALRPSLPRRRPLLVLAPAHAEQARRRYLPRLRDEATLYAALQRLVENLADPFAYAAAFDEETGAYEGVVDGKALMPGRFESGLLVRREAIPAPVRELEPPPYGAKGGSKPSPSPPQPEERGEEAPTPDPRPERFFRQPRGRPRTGGVGGRPHHGRPAGRSDPRTGEHPARAPGDCRGGGRRRVSGGCRRHRERPTRAISDWGRRTWDSRRGRLPGDRAMTRRGQAAASRCRCSRQPWRGSSGADDSFSAAAREGAPPAPRPALRPPGGRRSPSGERPLPLGEQPLQLGGRRAPRSG